MTVIKNDPKIDSERANRVPVVLRARFVRLVGGQKYVFDEISVVAVLKNESHHTFAGSLEVGHYGWEPGVPPGEGRCTWSRTRPVTRTAGSCWVEVRRRA